MIQIYHNSRCGKSRNCLAVIQKLNLEHETINYLVDIQSFEKISEILENLGIKPIDLIRKKEKIWTDNFKNKKISDKEMIQAMVENPILIERPILVYKNKAIIARELSEIEIFLKKNNLI